MNENASSDLFNREKKSTVILIGILIIVILILYLLFDLIAPHFTYFNPLASPMQGYEFWEKPTVFLPLTQAFTDWLGFALSLATLFGTLFHYRIKKDAFYPFLGMALFVVGVFNVFHFLAIEQLLFAYAPLSGVIAFSGFLLRLALPISVLIVIPFFWTNTHYKIHRCSGILSSCGVVFLLLIILGFSLALFNNPLLFAFSKELARYSVIYFLPLVLILFVAFPFFLFHYRQAPSYFSYSLLLSLIPLLSIELYSFLSPHTGLANSLTFVNSLEILAFILPVVGIFADNALFYHELNKSKEEALSATETKNQFISSFSYHLRQPLTSILGYGQCLLDGYDGALNEQQTKSVSQVLRGAKYLTSLLDEIIDISKIEEGKLLYSPSEVSINALFASCIEVYAPKAEQRGITLTYVPLEADENIFIDDTRVKEIVFHVLQNALQHTQQGGITLTLSREDRFVHITIQDTGEGMDPEQLSGLYEPKIYPATESRSKMVGLGLVISKKILDALEGSIEITSEKGKGTTVSLLIPMEKA